MKTVIKAFVAVCVLVLLGGCSKVGSYYPYPFGFLRYYHDKENTEAKKVEELETRDGSGTEKTPGR